MSQSLIVGNVFQFRRLRTKPFAQARQMNAASTPKLYSLLVISGIFLVLYALGVVYLFTHKVHGQRRRWQPLDFVWVPMGGLTGVLMAALWWNSH